LTEPISPPAVAPAPRATRAQRFAWCLFDFANSSFNTVVTTFVYAVFFARTLVGDQQRGDLLWSRAMVVAGLTVALLSPLAGADADRTANKRRYLMACSFACIACTALLYFPAVPAGAARASDGAVAAALALVVVGSVAFEIAFVFYNAFLRDVAAPHELGRLSGYGWGFGYVGGLLSLALCLCAVGVGDLPPLLPTEGHVHVRATSLIAAGWFLLFSLPMFALVRDRPSARAAAGGAGIGASLRQVGRTLRELPRHGDLLRFLVARLLYNDALMALILLAGLYMGGTLAMREGEIMMVAIGLNVAAGLGAVFFAHLDDRSGARPVLIASLALLTAGTAIAVAWPTRSAFLCGAALVGLAMGPNQSSSRTLLARLTDPARSAEFYGLFALSGKATVWIGPLLFSLVRGFDIEQRFAFLPLLVLFAAGLCLVVTVREPRAASPVPPSLSGNGT
jgi:UMF1 family MFS transporter